HAGAGAGGWPGIKRPVERASARAVRRCAVRRRSRASPERRSETGDDDGFAGEVVVRAAVEAAEDLDLREAGSGQEVLDLIPEEVAHLRRDRPALGTPALAADLVAERHLEDLCRRIAPDAGEADDLGASLPPTNLGELPLLEDGDPIELRRKDIEREGPAGREMPLDRLEARQF